MKHTEVKIQIFLRAGGQVLGPIKTLLPKFQAQEKGSELTMGVS